MINKLITVYLMLFFILFTNFCEAGTIKAELTSPPQKNYRILYYDNEFLFVGRDYGDHRDFGGNTEPGFFVHSKKLDRWLLITEISTNGAKFGKTNGYKNKADGKKMMQCSVGWDFTKYKDKDFIGVPLKTSGSIAFPERVLLDQERNKYLLIFFASWKIEEVETILEIDKADLIEEFKKIYNP